MEILLNLVKYLGNVEASCVEANQGELVRLFPGSSPFLLSSSTTRPRFGWSLRSKQERLQSYTNSIIMAKEAVADDIFERLMMMLHQVHISSYFRNLEPFLWSVTTQNRRDRPRPSLA